MNEQRCEIRSIKPAETFDWLLRIHYARRVPQIQHSFGMFIDRELVGVVTYGVPSSAPLRDGIAGSENAHLVLELNRLCFAKQIQNGPSMLVGRSLRLLPRPSIVISYADTAQGHIGYVYQSCNFIYTGLSAKRTDWKVKGLEHLHGQTIADMSKAASGVAPGSRAQFMRDKFGDDFYLEDRPRKHRYIYIVGTKSEKLRITSQLRYTQEPFPKGETKRYEITAEPEIQHVLF